MSEGDKKKEDKTKNEFTKACRCLFENKIKEFFPIASLVIPIVIINLI